MQFLDEARVTNSVERFTEVHYYYISLSPLLHVIRYVGDKLKELRFAGSFLPKAVLQIV